MMLSPSVVRDAHTRIVRHIHPTPILSSSLLNQWLGHEVYFKVEGMQRIGAFKIRGALNALFSLKEQGSLSDRIVTLSSGNHAQATALASNILGTESTIYIPKFASPVKRQAAISYGAKVELTDTRQEAEAEVAARVKEGAYLLHPYDDDDIIAGQGTACYEALQEVEQPDAIFATCGGGGWLSGTFLAKALCSPHSKVIAGEPHLGNDAAQSYRAGKIITLPDSPKTIADGARTLAVSERTFEYLKQLDGFYEVEEDAIIYWTQWLTHLLKTTVEPTSAVAMGAAAQWLVDQPKGQRIVVMLSGGNIAPDVYRTVWQQEYLSVVPGRRGGQGGNSNRS